MYLYNDMAFVILLPLVRYEWRFGQMGIRNGLCQELSRQPQNESSNPARFEQSIHFYVFRFWGVR
ncbi:MAG: hypothetical protein MUO53_17005 [Maribacter sp.]|nr:hypothetical protein [Maribacter sp.]